MSDDDWTAGIDVLVFDECCSCGRRWYLPHDHCPNCGSPDHRRRPSTGIGTVAASTVVHTRTDDDGRTGICLVDLDEGVRVMGGAEPTLRVGDRVRVIWEQHRPVFRSSADTPGCSCFVAHPANDHALSRP